MVIFHSYVSLPEGSLRFFPHKGGTFGGDWISLQSNIAGISPKKIRPLTSLGISWPWEMMTIIFRTNDSSFCTSGSSWGRNNDLVLDSLGFRWSNRQCRPTGILGDGDWIPKKMALDGEHGDKAMWISACRVLKKTLFLAFRGNIESPRRRKSWREVSIWDSESLDVQPSSQGGSEWLLSPVFGHQKSRQLSLKVM